MIWAHNRAGRDCELALDLEPDLPETLEYHDLARNHLDNSS